MKEYDVYWYYDNDSMEVSVETLEATSSEEAEYLCQRINGDRDIDFEDVIVTRVEDLDE